MSQSYICCQTFSEEHDVGTKSMYFIYQRFADVQKQKTSKLCQTEACFEKYNKRRNDPLMDNLHDGSFLRIWGFLLAIKTVTLGKRNEQLTKLCPTSKRLPFR